MHIFIRLLVFVVGIVLAGQVWAADTYTIDPAHSTMGFSVRHMMVSTVIGAFDDYQGAITYAPADPAAFKADVTIQAKSIDTRQPKRDDHLRSPDFFDVEKYPAITFVSKNLANRYYKPGSGPQPGIANPDTGFYSPMVEMTLVGDLTIKGITKEVSIPVTISGPVQGMGGPLIGLSGSLIINRQDYGINWNKALDNGGLAVSDEVKVDVNIEAHKK